MPFLLKAQTVLANAALLVLGCDWRAAALSTAEAFFCRWRRAEPASGMAVHQEELLPGSQLTHSSSHVLEGAQDPGAASEETKQVPPSCHFPGPCGETQVPPWVLSHPLLSHQKLT